MHLRRRSILKTCWAHLADWTQIQFLYSCYCCYCCYTQRFISGTRATHSLTLHTIPTTTTTIQQYFKCAHEIDTYIYLNENLMPKTLTNGTAEILVSSIKHRDKIDFLINFKRKNRGRKLGHIFFFAEWPLFHEFTVWMYDRNSHASTELSQSFCLATQFKNTWTKRAYAKQFFLFRFSVAVISFGFNNAHFLRIVIFFIGIVNSQPLWEIMEWHFWHVSHSLRIRDWTNFILLFSGDLMKFFIT